MRPARAGDTRARMHRGSAQVKAANGRTIAREVRHRPHPEELIERDLGVIDLSLGYAPRALEVERRAHCGFRDGALNRHNVPRQTLNDGACERVTTLVVP